MSELETAALTALFGVTVYVTGQILQKFIIEPLQEQRKLKGEIAFALIYFANVNIVFNTEIEKEKAVDASKELRKLASDLRRGLELIPLYWFFAFLRIVPSSKAIYKASEGLVGWSNTVFREDTEHHRNMVANALHIKRW